MASTPTSTSTSKTPRTRNLSGGSMVSMIALGARGPEEDPQGTVPAAVAPLPKLPPTQAEMERSARFKRELADIPTSCKTTGGEKLVACMICSLIKSIDQFDADGCDNCEQILHVAGQRGGALLHTSENFEGFIALMEPRESWVAKWQRIRTMKRGLYATSVSGVLPPDIRHELEAANVNYVIRDKSIAAKVQRQRELEAEMDDDLTMKRRAARKIRRNRRRQKKKEKKNRAKSDDSDEGNGEDGANPLRVPTLKIVHGGEDGYSVAGGEAVGSSDEENSNAGASGSDSEIEGEEKLDNSTAAAPVYVGKVDVSSGEQDDEDIKDV